MNQCSTAVNTSYTLLASWQILLMTPTQQCQSSRAINYIITYKNGRLQMHGKQSVIFPNIEV